MVLSYSARVSRCSGDGPMVPQVCGASVATVPLPPGPPPGGAPLLGLPGPERPSSMFPVQPASSDPQQTNQIRTGRVGPSMYCLLSEKSRTTEPSLGPRPLPESEPISESVTPQNVILPTMGITVSPSGSEPLIVRF